MKEIVYQEGRKYICFLILISLKSHWWRGRRPNFLIFVVWSALIAGGWMVVLWSRKSSLGPVKIASFLCLVLFKDEGRRLSPRLHLFVSYVNHWNEEAG